MTLDLRASTHASMLFEDNPAINSAIESIVDEVRRARATIKGAGPAASDLKETYQSYLQRQQAVKGKPAYYPYVGSGLGNGPLVELLDGSVKWDLISGIGVHMFGHSDPELIEIALRAALSDTVMQGNLQFNLDAIEFGELLIEEAAKTSRLRHAFIINSGALANETALKVCMHKKDGKAPRILAFADCFMGRTTTMCQIGDSAAGRQGIPLNTQVDYVSFYDPEHGDASIDLAARQLEQYVLRYPGQHACFVMELVQGEGGFNIAPREFFTALMDICRKHDVPIWIDEIQTFGRTTSMYHFEALRLGEFVDVLTLGKMSQVCACLYTEEFNPKAGLLSATFIGSSIGVQVGKRILERLRDGGYYGEHGKIARLQEEFRERMDVFVQTHPEWFPAVPHPHNLTRTATGMFGGVGGMMRFTPFGGDKKSVIDTCHALFDEGVICFYCGHGPYHVRFLPPIGVMRPEHFDEVFEILDRGLARIASRA